MKFWNLIFLLGLLAYVVIRGIFEQRVKDSATALSRSDGRERALLLLMFIGGLLLPAVYLFSDWLKFADYRLPAFVPWCGAAALLAALWLFWRSHADLGQNWSRTLEIRREHQLVTHGVYGSIRHPMYAAIWLFSLAQGLMLENWLAGWSAFVAFGATNTRFRRPVAIRSRSSSGRMAIYGSLNREKPRSGALLPAGWLLNIHSRIH